MWSISVTKRVKVEQWESVVYLPTFFLDEKVQGIMDAHHCESIVRMIVPDAVSISCFKI